MHEMPQLFDQLPGRPDPLHYGYQTVDLGTRGSVTVRLNRRPGYDLTRVCHFIDAGGIDGYERVFTSEAGALWWVDLPAGALRLVVRTTAPDSPSVMFSFPTRTDRDTFTAWVMDSVE